jgi:hypothetical protein
MMAVACRDKPYFEVRPDRPNQSPDLNEVSSQLEEGLGGARTRTIAEELTGAEERHAQVMSQMHDDEQAGVSDRSTAAETRSKMIHAALVCEHAGPPPA